MDSRVHVLEIVGQCGHTFEVASRIGSLCSSLYESRGLQIQMDKDYATVTLQRHTKAQIKIQRWWNKVLYELYVERCTRCGDEDDTLWSGLCSSCREDSYERRIERQRERWSDR